jgi:hypothetical protein
MTNGLSLFLPCDLNHAQWYLCGIHINSIILIFFIVLISYNPNIHVLPLSALSATFQTLLPNCLFLLFLDGKKVSPPLWSHLPSHPASYQKKEREKKTQPLASSPFFNHLVHVILSSLLCA